jgi:predicted aminopeptidase
VNTVIHESVHSTVWIKNNVPFNESLANFIGTEGALAFFKAQSDACSEGADGCAPVRAALSAAAADRMLQYDLSELIGGLFASLERLYGDPKLSSEEKIARRSQVFEEQMSPFRARHPRLQILKEINNAEIVQLKLYLSDLIRFHRLFERGGRDWGAFLARIREIEKAIDEGARKDPFEVLREMIGETV